MENFTWYASTRLFLLIHFFGQLAGVYSKYRETWDFVDEQRLQTYTDLLNAAKVCQNPPQIEQKSSNKLDAMVENISSVMSIQEELASINEDVSTLLSLFIPILVPKLLTCKLQTRKIEYRKNAASFLFSFFK